MLSAVSGQPEFGQSANTYAVLAKLATGGMAEIFLARNASGAGIERYVVLKRVLRHKANDETFVHMFLDEARLAAQLQHPNIAQVYDTGVLGDSYFFTMEYVHGETMREILHRTFAQELAIPISAVLTIGAAAAAGLQHAHDRKGMDGQPLRIVHRDISPSNLMVSFEGIVKIVDFGIAKATHRRTETQSGTVKGKIAYLSPEQCRGRVIDRRSDLFSLGIVLWEALVGDRLFKQATDYEIMEAIVMSTAPPPSSRRGGVPHEVDEIVCKLLARDPDKRFQTAGELLEAIERTAVRVGVPLSANALGRFVRDLFGQRPEPWIEMQTRDAPPEVVTVTAASEIGTEELELLDDDRLAAVPDLQSRSITRTPTPLPFRIDESTLPLPTAAAAGSTSYNEFPSSGSYTSVSPAPKRPRRALAIGLSLAAVGGVFALVLAIRHGGRAEAPRAAPAPIAEPTRPIETQKPTVEVQTPAVEAQTPAVEAPNPPPVAPSNAPIGAPTPVDTSNPADTANAATGAPTSVDTSNPADTSNAATGAPTSVDTSSAAVAAKPGLETPKPRIEAPRPKPKAKVESKLEATKPKPKAKVESALEPAKPKVEPPKPEPTKPKIEPPKPESTKPTPKVDCDVDPMSCRR